MSKKILLETESSNLAESLQLETLKEQLNDARAAIVRFTVISESTLYFIYKGLKCDSTFFILMTISECYMQLSL